MLDTGSLPRLSQIQAWPVAHLHEAGSQWMSAAQQWEDSFTAVYHEAALPGGTAWDGQAADAAVQQVGTDRLKVLSVADNLRAAAAVARKGAAELLTARQLTLAVVATAESAGFTVGEDLSLTARLVGPSSSQTAQAQQIAATIHSRAAALVALDRDVAARMSAANSGLNSISFSETPTELLSGGPFPTGPVVWCRLQGTGGSSWRCSVVYPGGGVAWYWSTTDDSGGYGP